MSRPDAPAPGLLTSRAAAARLGVSVRHLYELQLPRVDVAVPGAERASWRYDPAALDAFVARRTQLPLNAPGDAGPARYAWRPPWRMG